MVSIAEAEKGDITWWELKIQISEQGAANSQNKLEEIGIKIRYHGNIIAVDRI